MRSLLPTCGAPCAAIATPACSIWRIIAHHRVRHCFPLAPGAASYAQGVRVADLMFVSGQVEVDAHGRLLGPGDIQAQTRQALTNVQTILRLADLDIDDIVKTTVMLTDWRHYVAYNDIYREFFAAPYPARSTVCGGLACPGALIEIEAVAAAGVRHTAVAVTSP